jgi:alpha-1,3-mannosyltransferase
MLWLLLDEVTIRSEAISLQSSNLKIIHVVRQFSPSVGGLESAVLNLAAVQRTCFGIDARLVTLNRVFGKNEILAAEDTTNGVPVFRLPWRGSRRYPIAPSVLRHLQTADVVHVHAIDFFFDFLALSRPFHGRTLVASTHGGIFHTPMQARLKKLWFNTITRASVLAYHRIIACSRSDADMFRNIAGRRLAIIENGIDQTKFMHAAAPTQTRTIIYFGRFAAHKRIDHIFLLLAHLHVKNPAWRLIIAGRDADQSSEQLKIMAKQARVAESVSFFINPNDAALRLLIGSASYFACLSDYEGFGIAAVEAMSAGLLPILSGISPFQRLYDETKIGIISDIDEPAETAMALERSVLKCTDAYSLRQAQTCDAVQQYNWENAAAEYIRIYQDAIDANAGEAARHMKLQ